MSRIYAVTDKASGDTRLVRATTKTVALRHVADQLFTATSATQDQIVEGLQSGVAVELAGAAPAEGEQE